MNDPFGSQDTPNNPEEPTVPTGDAAPSQSQPEVEPTSPWAPRPEGGATQEAASSTPSGAPTTPPPTTPPPGTPPTTPPGGVAGAPSSPGQIPPYGQTPPGSPYPGLGQAYGAPGPGMAPIQKPYSPVPWIILGVLGILSALVVGGAAIFFGYSGIYPAGVPSAGPIGSEDHFFPSEFFDDYPSEGLEDIDPSEFPGLPSFDPSNLPSIAPNLGEDSGPPIEQSRHGMQGESADGIFYESPLGNERKDAGEVMVGKPVDGSTPKAGITAYKVNLKAGQKIKISIVAKDFGDLCFWMLDPEQKLIAFQDDGQADLDPYLEFNAPVDGTYELLIGTTLGDAESNYTLTIHE